eukprot:20443-Heterococcus_DN1.PRE.2
MYYLCTTIAIVYSPRYQPLNVPNTSHYTTRNTHCKLCTAAAAPLLALVLLLRSGAGSSTKCRHTTWPAGLSTVLSVSSCPALAAGT